MEFMLIDAVQPLRRNSKQKRGIRVDSSRGRKKEREREKRKRVERVQREDSPDDFPLLSLSQIESNRVVRPRSFSP